MTMDDLVSVQIFCPDVANYDAFNSVYRTYFKKEYPARAFLGSGPPSRYLIVISQMSPSRLCRE